jgi:uncharacterized protein involved in outer membrane biogenesis
LADADLVSTRLDYKDLGGLVGLPPCERAGQRANRRAEQGGGENASCPKRVLPTRPYDVDKFRIIDARGSFQGKRFQASNLPLDDMSANVELRDAVLKLQPIDFGIAGGHVTSTLVLDAREKLIKIDGDVTVRSVELTGSCPRSSRRREAPVK